MNDEYYPGSLCFWAEAKRLVSSDIGRAAYITERFLGASRHDDRLHIREQLMAQVLGLADVD